LTFGVSGSANALSGSRGQAFGNDLRGGAVQPGHGKEPKTDEMKGKDTWEIGHYTRIPQLNERGVNLE
jgi:hypothetical protein